MQNQDTNNNSPQTSGTIAPISYTREQILDGLYLYSVTASEALAKAKARYQEDMKKVSLKLEKNGIPLAEFTKYVTEKETATISH